MTGTTTTPLADAVTLCEQSAGYALHSLSDLTDADLDRPTPCPGWDLRTLLLHLAGTADALTELVTTGNLNLTTTPPPHVDPVAAARDRIHRLRDTLTSTAQRDPSGQTAEQTRWATTAAHAGAIELAAHGWDISTARRADHQIPTGLAVALLDLSRSLIDDDARFPRFGQPVQVPPTATPNDRFIAFLGRQPAPRD